MARLSSLRSRIPRGPRRKTSWSVGPRTADAFGTPGPAFSGNSALLAATGAAVLSDGVTMVRLRGQLSAWLITADAVSTGFACAFGIGLARLPAFTAGIASLPTPFTDEDDELWVYHKYFGLFTPAAIAGGASTDADHLITNVATLNIEVDSKAMRKMDVNDVLYAALEVQEQGVATGNWAFSCRTLFKLP